MKTYAQFKPTGFDVKGLNADTVGGDNLVFLSQNRDSDALERSNFRVACNLLQATDPDGLDHEVHRFGHWACGWFEIIVVSPGTPAEKKADELGASLNEYPVLDESDFSKEEEEEASLTWANCYSRAERIEYIREHRSQFEFHGLADMLGCVRGRHFSGYASELTQ